MEDQRRRITRAKMTLMRAPDFALMSSILALGKVIIDPNVKTACTDGINEMYSPDFLAQLNDKQVACVVAHENFHKMGRHLYTYSALAKKCHQTANVAMDYWINLKLTECDPNGKYLEPPTVDGKLCWLYDDKYKDMSIPQIFREVYKEQGGKGKGQGGEDGFDEHDWESADGLSDEERKAIEREVEQAIRQGKIAHDKYAGKDSKGNPLERAIEDLLKPKVPWQVLLRDFLTSHVKGSDEGTWSPVSRRSLAQGYYSPSYVKESMSRIGTAPDVSASIASELTRAMSEMKHIFEDIQPDAVDMMYWDTAVTSHETYEGEDVRNIHNTSKPVGGGGTSPDCVFRYVKDNKLELDCLLLFTDGYVYDWGKDIGIPTMWCVINNEKAVAPFGKTIHVEV